MKFEAKILRVPAAALLLAAALGVTIPAVSLANEEAKASVQVSDLNLASKGDQRRLERRTAAAIEQVCPLRGSVSGPRAITNAARRECVQTVRASVKQQLDERGARAVAVRD